MAPNFDIAVDLTACENADSGRLLISSGVRSWRSKPAYKHEAKVPIPDWRELDRSEAAKFLGPQMKSAKTTVSLARVSDESVSLVRHQSYATSRGILSAEEREQQGVNACRAILSDLEETVEFDSDIKIIGYRSAKAHGPTQTVDYYGEQKKPGLHIDSWYGDEVAGRLDRPARICVNVGSHHRYFLFLPISIDEIVKETGPLESAVDVVHVYLASAKGVPVLALRVDPGEFYLASTEFFLHDGWCPETAVTDETFTVLGGFTLREPEAGRRC